MTLKPYLSFITLGAEDVGALADFYEQAFGWQPATRRPEVVFFKLNGFVFAIFGRADLAADAGIAIPAPPAHASEIPNAGPEAPAAASQADPSAPRVAKPTAFAHNLGSEAEVDAAYARLLAHGARGVKPPQKTFWGGYAAYIADPEGNLWELAHNPFMQMDPEGNVLSLKIS